MIETKMIKEAIVARHEVPDTKEYLIDIRFSHPIHGLLINGPVSVRKNQHGVFLDDTLKKKIPVSAFLVVKKNIELCIQQHEEKKA